MRRTPYLLLVAMTMMLSVSICSCSEDPEEKEKKEQEQDKSVEDWDNIDMNGDAIMESASMRFSVGDSLHVVQEGSTRASTTVAGITTFSENDIVTISVASSYQDSVAKNYIVANDGTDLSFAGTPTTNEFHWESSAETVKLRAWSYGKGITTDQYNTAQASPHNVSYSLPTNQSGGYGELLYCAQEISYLTAKAQGGIVLNMHHQLARIIVKLKRKAADDTSDIESVTIGDGSVSIPTSATFVMPKTFSQQTGGWKDISKTAATITCHEDTPTSEDTAAGIEAVYSAVVIPDTYASGINLIQVTMSDDNKYNYATTAATTLSAGNQYIFTITIGDDVATLQATYPTEWTASGFPITSYNSGESFGVYVYDGSTPVYSNVEMTAKATGSTVTLNAGSIYNKLSTSYTYYIYYPYTSSPGAVVAGAASAEAFFTGLMGSWSPAASQSNTESLRANDLQMGMISPTASDNRKNQTRTATMAHKMGLAVMTLGTRSVPTVQYHNASGTLLDDTTDGTTTSVTASSTFSTNIPCLSSSKYYAVINGSRTFTGTGADGWTYSPNASGGSVVTNTIYSKRTFIRKGWQYDCVGAVQTFTAPVAGNYKLEAWGAGAGQNPTKNKGGYAYGNINRTANSNLYICVGGFGGMSTSYSEALGGITLSTTLQSYNGGGGVDANGVGLNSANPGGGATHFAINNNRGVLKNYKSYQSEVLLVAGGSGANEWDGTGGTGGGTTGGNGSVTKITTETASYYGTGGSQSAGGTSRDGVTGNTTGLTAKIDGDFGQGGIAARSGDYGAGGGGGWYGGGGTAYAGGAGGGSGHIGSGFISGSTGMQNGVKTGHGRARVTCQFDWTF